VNELANPHGRCDTLPHISNSTLISKPSQIPQRSINSEPHLGFCCF